MTVDPVVAEEILVRSCREQSVPVVVEDVATIAAVAVLIAEPQATHS